MKNRPQKSVLVVDDDPDILKIIGILLKLSGFRVLEASNGQEALEVIGDHRPDLIVLDFKMPVMDGYQTCLCLQEDPDLSQIPVIFVSAYLDEIPTESLAGQVIDQVKKPFDPKKLVVDIRNQLISQG